MFCMYCGKELEGGDKFCPHCGHAVNRDASRADMPQPIYYVPIVQPTQPARKGKLNALGIAGFSTAVVAALLACTELGGFLCFILALPAFGLSLAGVILKKKYSRVWGLALAGLIISSAVLVLAVLVIVIFICVVLLGSLVFAI